MLSMFLTNDVALFIVIPLILNFQDRIKNDTYKLIIYAAISVNVGSLLTPIGNPQNILLWTKWNISFFTFILNTLPLELIMISILVIFILIIFRKKPLEIDELNEKVKLNKNLAINSLILFPCFIFLMELRLEIYLIPIILISYFILDRNLMKDVNWLFLLTFILFFADVNLLIRLKPIYYFISGLNFEENIFTFFTFTIILSQIISNVPATILLLNFSSNYQAITWAVNIAGNGTLVSSFANIIALKIGKTRGLVMKFHEHSLLYLLISTSITLFIIFIFLIF